MLGRFTSPDSIVPEPGSVIGYNRYAYVANNPMIYTDPSGHSQDGGIGDPDFLKPKPITYSWDFLNSLGSSSSQNKDNKSSIGNNRITETDTDQDGVPNNPDPFYPATQMGRGEQVDCLPGNLVECFYNQGVMPSGDYDITYEEYYALMLAISYDIKKQGPIKNYEEIRGVYDTPFFNLLGAVDGTICIEGNNCRNRKDYNYIAQGMWSAASLEGPEGMLATVVGWKYHEYKHLPSIDTLASANEGYTFYSVTHPVETQLMLRGYKNYISGIIAFVKNW